MKTVWERRSPTFPPHYTHGRVAFDGSSANET